MSGLWSKSAEPPEGTTGSDHWVAAAYLTGIKPRKTAGSDATVGSRPSISSSRIRSVRKRCCRRCSSPSRIRTRARATAVKATAARTPTRISWSRRCRRRRTRPVERTSPLPMELNPQVVFERLFGSGATPEVRAQRMRQSRSILDSVLGELPGPAEGPRRVRSANGQPVHRRDSRDRAPHPARREGVERRAGDGSAAGHPGAVRRSHQAALRSRRRWRSRPTSPAWRRCSARAT